MTGHTSNPTIFDHAIKSGTAYDASIARSEEGKSGEELFFELALEDITAAADLFAGPGSDERRGRVGVLEVSPMLAYDTREHHRRRQRSARRAATQPVHQDPGYERSARH